MARIHSELEPEVKLEGLFAGFVLINILQWIIADLGPTFRDLSIGTLILCGLFDRLAAA